MNRYRAPKCISLALTAWVGMVAVGYAAAAEAPRWHGADVMTGGKGYAPTPMGQVHYRDVGQGPPVLLLHQTPWFMVQYAEVQNHMKTLGVRAIAPDTPGFGMSDAPTKPPTIPDYADNLVALLDYLKIRKIAVAGHHTGADIAVAFAARHPDRVSALIIHGTPLYTAEERAERLARPHRDQSMYADGRQLTSIFQSIVRITGEAPNNLKSVTWSTIANLLAGESEGLGHVAAFSYDMEPDLRAVKAPGLILSDAGDMLRAMDDKAIKLRPDFARQTFSQESAHALMNDPKRWAEIVAAFVKAHAGDDAGR